MEEVGRNKQTKKDRWTNGRQGVGEEVFDKLSTTSNIDYYTDKTISKYFFYQ